MEQAKKPSGCLRNVLILFAAIAVYSAFVPDRAENTVAESEYVEPTTQSVTYRVTGTAKTVSVTIATPDGTSQHDGLAVPWVMSNDYPPGAWLYISAQIEDGWGTVTATIEIDGEVYKTTTSSGEYVIASVSGSP